MIELTTCIYQEKCESCLKLSMEKYNIYGPWYEYVDHVNHTL